MLRAATRMISADEIPTLDLLYRRQKMGPSLLGAFNHATSAYNNRIGIIRGDITTLAVDAIVNAANTSLLGGGGVDGAIHRAAGRELLAECRNLNGCATGSSKITNAYRLPCNKVIHAVGPVYSDRYPQRCETALRGCYQSALQLAVQNGLKTIAFSAISTGVYGYPSYDAASVACSTVKAFLGAEYGNKLDKVVFVTFEEKDVRVYNNLLPRFFPPEDAPYSDSDDATEEQIIEAEATANQLPSVPQTDPSDTEHVQKKQRQDSDN
ncbi:MACRO domain-containing protein [Xylaria castorea]|nr:MACRO domain-containing protein [Xylaria castorea]